MPLAAAMQPGAFFLPFIMLLGLFDGLVLLKISMQVIAGIATYGLLRTLGLGRWASCLGGVLFQLSGIFAFFRMRRSCRHHSSLCCCWQLKDVCNEQRRA